MAFFTKRHITLTLAALTALALILTGCPPDTSGGGGGGNSVLVAQSTVPERDPGIVFDQYLIYPYQAWNEEAAWKIALGAYNSIRLNVNPARDEPKLESYSDAEDLAQDLKERACVARPPDHSLEDLETKLQEASRDQKDHRFEQFKVLLFLSYVITFDNSPTSEPEIVDLCKYPVLTSQTAIAEHLNK